MEIDAKIKAVASSSELLGKLFSLMAEDIKTDHALHGEIKPLKKNGLENTWYGLRFTLLFTNPPLGYYMYNGTDGIAWEQCMMKWAGLLKNDGCVVIEFPNSITPDYSVEMCTTSDGSYLIYETDKEIVLGPNINHDAYCAASYYCDDLFNGPWKTDDFKAKAGSVVKTVPKKTVKKEETFVQFLYGLPHRDGKTIGDAFVDYLEEDVEKLRKKYTGKPAPGTYKELKEKNPKFDWNFIEDTIRDCLGSTPAAYFKEIGLVCPGQAKAGKTAKTSEKAKVTNKNQGSPAGKTEEKKAAAIKKNEPDDETQKKTKTKKPVQKSQVPAEELTGTRLIKMYGKTTIKESKYREDPDPRPVEIPEGVIEIGNNAFYKAGLSAVKLPKSLRTIGIAAFNSCPDLEEVEIQEGLEKIDFVAFGLCPKLKKIQLPSTIRVINRYAFADESIKEEISHIVVHMPGKVASLLVENREYEIFSTIVAAGFIIDGVPYPSPEKYVVDKLAEKMGIHLKPDEYIPITNGKTVVEAEWQNASARKIIIPEGVTKIDGGAFAGCGIEEVVLPHSLKVIDGGAFRNCRKLRSIELPEGLETIGYHAFTGTTMLTDIHIPGSVVSMDPQAFTDEDGKTDSHITVYIYKQTAKAICEDNMYNYKKSSAKCYVTNGRRYPNLYELIETEEKLEKQRRQEAEAERRRKEEEERLERERRAAEKARQQKRKDLEDRIIALEKERDSQKGLFAGMKKKKIQQQIDELRERLNRL